MKVAGGFIDIVGQALSLLCIVHCAAMPLVLAAVPTFAGVFGRAHPVLLILVFATALWSFVPGYRHHRNLSVLLLGIAGVALLAMGTLPSNSLATETAFSVSGAGLMLFAHWKNRTAHRHCDHCEAEAKA